MKTLEVVLDSEYISIYEWPKPKPIKKTSLYEIRNKKSGQTIGFVKWYGAWRQYCFFPDRDTVWNIGCLTEINKFLAKLKEERKEKL